MPSLKVNGWTVPVEKAALSFIEVGTYKRSFSGVQRRNLRARKRSWNITTPSLPLDDAAALEGMLACLGEYWPFDTDAYSAKGRWPVLVNSGVVIASTPTKYGAGSLYAQGPSTNILASNIATGTDTLANTTGWARTTANEAYGATPGVGATLSSDTGASWQGSRSLLVQAPSGNYYGVKTTVTGLTGGATYTFSCYMYGYAGLQASVSINAVASNNVGLNTGAANLVTSASWQRFSITFTMPNAVTAVEIRLGETLDNSYSWRVDGCMLNTGTVAQAWADGGVIGTTLQYDLARHLSPLPPTIAVNGWFNSPVAGGCVFALAGGPYPLVKLMYTGSGLYTMTIWTDSGSPANYSAVVAPSGWQMLTLILRSYPTPQVRLLINGTDAMTPAAFATPMTFSAMNQLHVGNYGGASQYGGYIDELNFFNYLPSAGLLNALAGGTKPQGLQPQLLCEGDFIPGRSLVAVASDVKIAYSPRNSASGWLSNSGKVSFTLAEV